MTGQFAYITDKGWYVKHLQKVGGPNSDSYKLTLTPLHPDHIALAKDKAWINFEIQTIATGSSEFDIEDIDVAIPKM